MGRLGPGQCGTDVLRVVGALSERRAEPGEGRPAEGDVLICPDDGSAYDVRTGERVRARRRAVAAAVRDTRGGERDPGRSASWMTRVEGGGRTRELSRRGAFQSWRVALVGPRSSGARWRAGRAGREFHEFGRRRGSRRAPRGRMLRETGVVGLSLGRSVWQRRGRAPAPRPAAPPTGTRAIQFDVARSGVRGGRGAGISAAGSVGGRIGCGQRSPDPQAGAPARGRRGVPDGVGTGSGRGRAGGRRRSWLVCRASVVVHVKGRVFVESESVERRAVGVVPGNARPEIGEDVLGGRHQAAVGELVDGVVDVLVVKMRTTCSSRTRSSAARSTENPVRGSMRRGRSLRGCSCGRGHGGSRRRRRRGGSPLRSIRGDGSGGPPRSGRCGSDRRFS